MRESMNDGVIFFQLDVVCDVIKTSAPLPYIENRAVAIPWADSNRIDRARARTGAHNP